MHDTSRTNDCDLRGLFQRVSAGTDLTVNEAKGVFGRIMAGQLNEAVIGALLGVVLTKAECVDELVGAAPCCDPNPKRERGVLAGRRRSGFGLFRGLRSRDGETVTHPLWSIRGMRERRHDPL